MMDKLIDIYLADLKYYNYLLGNKYSNCNDYFYYASKAIDEMYKQVGKFEIEDGLLKKGLVVRILLLPGGVEDCKKILKYLYSKYQDNIYMSIMNQYTPIEKYKYQELNRTVKDEEYDELINYACDLGIKNAFIQEGNVCNESFIPNFNLDNV